MYFRQSSRDSFLSYSASVCMEGLRKTMQTLSGNFVSYVRFEMGTS